jgi:UDP-N-acetylmuramoyl-tripeptide--D-alanyl-D-alanine ligase
MMASVKTFVDLYENPVVVLGNMGELGEDEEKYHKQVGEYVSSVCKGKNVKFLTVGDLAANIADVLEKCGYEVHKFETNTQASCYIVENLNDGYTIFLKASRSMMFEQILEDVKRGIVKL